MCIPRATVSAVSCLVVPAFICIDLLISRVLEINDDDDDDILHIFENGHNFATALPIDVLVGCRVPVWVFRLNIDFFQGPSYTHCCRVLTSR